MTTRSADITRLLLRVEEAADALGVSRTTLYGLLRSGAIPVIHIGRSVRVPLAALERYVAEETERTTILGYEG